MKKIIRVGSRKSDLAMVQTNWVINKIKAKHPELEFEIIGMKTKGDIVLDSRLDKIGGKGLFIKELETALIENRIDFAVHSLKDFPAEIPDELIICAVSDREDPADVLVTNDGTRLEDLRPGAVIGTGSLRREVQLLKIRPDLKFELLRGNVLTRLNKLLIKQYDAIVLAAAGLKRLGLYEKSFQTFNIDEMVPAVGQGVLAIEARKSFDANFILDSVHCYNSELESKAERSFMIRLNGGCTTPIAAHAVIEGENMIVYGMLASNDKEKLVKLSIVGNKHDGTSLGIRLAEILLEEMKKI